MTFQTFKRFVLMSVFFMTTSVVIYAQQSTMQGLIGQSLAKLQQPTSESILMICFLIASSPNFR